MKSWSADTKNKLNTLTTTQYWTWLKQHFDSWSSLCPETTNKTAKIFTMKVCHAQASLSQDAKEWLPVNIRKNTNAPGICNKYKCFFICSIICWNHQHKTLPKSQWIALRIPIIFFHQRISLSPQLSFFRQTPLFWPKWKEYFEL